MNAAKISDLLILFVEMQPPIVASASTQSAAAVRRTSVALKQIADDLEIPVIASAVPLGDEAPTLIDELASVEVQVRTSVSVVADDACRHRIAEHGRKTLVLAGVSSEIAILHTALDARGAGYEVAVLIDCCGGLSRRTEATALDQMRMAGVQVTNTSSFFTGMFSDMTSLEGRAVMGALAELWSWGPGDAAPLDEHDRAVSRGE
ncbi:hypothetical protein DMC47_00040 [Nostoc sp. 3335mG]|nr:hypothetical protein DMC47_00040 [Nostoc sp. 3335mG]